MQKYYSKHHASPLIVLKYMRLGYFQDDTSTGFYVCVTLHNKRRFDRLDLILDTVQEKQGDFKLCFQNGHEPRLQTTDKTGNLIHYLIAWEFRWKDCMKALLKIQRFVIAKKLKKVGCNPCQDIFKIKSLIQFKKSQILPSEIMEYILDLYWEH
jgi:hypothetical protein